mmetsp:Transcript_27112/g.49532  ORF Transcript_27112/g.49532 Transcript_27112/m.49532 type:complete len:272 (+) Transcript_27112:160-975(+)
MAYGLRSIVNSGYMPYGSGRDWFFVGDHSYRNGRRTPDANNRKPKGGGEPKMQYRGEPKEMRQTKSIHKNLGGTGIMQRGSSKVDDRVSPVRASKWREHLSSDTCNDVIQRAKASTGSVHSSRWREQLSSTRPVKAALRKSASVPTSLWNSAYKEEVGQVHLISDWSASDWGAAEKHRYHSSRVFPPRDVQQVPPEPEWRPPAWGEPHKHRYSSMPCFPPKDMQAETAKVPKAIVQSEWGVPEKHLYHSLKIFPDEKPSRQISKKEVDEPR